MLKKLKAFKSTDLANFLLGSYGINLVLQLPTLSAPPDRALNSPGQRIDEQSDDDNGHDDTGQIDRRNFVDLRLRWPLEGLVASIPKNAKVGAAEFDFVPVGGGVPSPAAELSLAEHLEFKQNEISLTKLYSETVARKERKGIKKRKGFAQRNCVRTVQQILRDDVCFSGYSLPFRFAKERGLGREYNLRFL